ncbi:PadR family transcripitonal regulator [Asticcacaulis sp. AC460]|uniref:PadR family transcriptional regulator n=1 Tax=Asticcacaulis sp. AC460 TaxID=1282360 RepID=UPI0003C3B557|nr:PadR family transcriptional regulator [Asticcacaulis sp. AC460]ESQ89017.1 PadR family transcripitonal regulator [Asticcacaulis sp. AC460]
MRDFPFNRGGFSHHGGHHAPHGGHRFGGRGRRDGRGFGHGGLRLVLLKFISEKPSHGYELIKAIEEQFQGGYAPSPGIVYPALSWLEDGGFIVITTDADNRKVASITEAGQALLAERAEDLERLFETAADKPGNREDYAPLYRAMDNLKAALRTRAIRPMSKTDIENIVDWIDDLARKIERSE